MAIRFPSYHIPSSPLFPCFTSFPLPLGRPLQNYPSQTMSTFLSLLYIFSTPLPVLLPLQKSPAYSQNWKRSVPLPCFYPALNSPSQVQVAYLSMMAPLPWKSPLRKAPSQMEPVFHSNLPFPSLPPELYSPLYVPLLFFSIPCPCGSSLLHPPVQLRLVTSLAQLPSVLLLPTKQLAFGYTKMDPLRWGQFDSLRYPQKQPWNSPLSRNLYIWTHPLGSYSESCWSVLAQMMLYGCLIFHILLVLWGWLVSFLILYYTCLLSMGKALTSTLSLRIFLRWFSFEAT